MTESRDDALEAHVVAAVRGDRGALEYVLGAIRPMVIRYCRARLGRAGQSFASADDVAQEVCLAVLRALPTYRDQGRPFLAFVYGIAGHKVSDAHRGDSRNRSEPMSDVPDSPEGSTGPEEHALRRETAGEMGRLLEVLSPTQREIVLLRVVNGLSAIQTAQVVGCTPSAVRVAQHRGLARLRTAMAQCR